jgi:hypothetical protein
MFWAAVDVINVSSLWSNPFCHCLSGSHFYRPAANLSACGWDINHPRKQLRLNVRSLSATTNSENALPGADYGAGITAVA